VANRILFERMNFMESSRRNAIWWQAFKTIQ